MENKNNYASDSEVRILLANVSFEELSESDDTSLYSGKNVEVLENSYVSITSKKVVLKVYKRRWFILGLFSLLSFMQCTVWNTWGPIAESSLTAFPSWDAKTIALFGNWGTITFVIFTVPLIWLCDLYGTHTYISLLFLKFF